MARMRPYPLHLHRFNIERRHKNRQTEEQINTSPPHRNHHIDAITLMPPHRRCNIDTTTVVVWLMLCGKVSEFAILTSTQEYV